jgi:hypothetical protein
MTVIGLIVGLLAATATGCGGGAGGSPSSGGSGPRESEHPATSSAAAPAAGKTKHGRAPRCRPSDLVVFDDSGGNGALSTDYTHFTVGNLSRHACSVSGYPRLYAIGADGRQVGGAARPSRAPGGPRPRPVRISPEGTATFDASWRVDVYDRGVCNPTVVARYRVLLPAARHGRDVPFPTFHRCTNRRADRSLSVGPIEAESRRDGGGPSEPPRLPEARPDEHLPHCRPSQLLLYTGVDSPAGVGLGTSYFRVDIANLSGRACEISGWPHVVAVALDGRRVGGAAGHGTQISSAGAGRRPIKVAKIAGHGSGAILVATGSVYNYGRDACNFEMTAGLGCPARRPRRRSRCSCGAAPVTSPAAASYRSIGWNDSVPGPVTRCPGKTPITRNYVNCRRPITAPYVDASRTRHQMAQPCPTYDWRHGAIR